MVDPCKKKKEKKRKKNYVSPSMKYAFSLYHPFPGVSEKKTFCTAMSPKLNRVTSLERRYMASV
jgi:hypothetical protein